MKKAFCLRVSTPAARCAAACFSRHLRDLGAGLREKGRARNRLTGIRTRGLAAAESASPYMGQGCVRFKAHDIRISALTALTLRLSEEMVAT
jgi:hypothetical protein